MKVEHQNGIQVIMKPTKGFNQSRNLTNYRRNLGHGKRLYGQYGLKF